MLLNELDQAFTEHGIETRIAFIAYLDLLWTPQEQRLANPDRFVLLFAPISRSYSQSYNLDTSDVVLPPYERNQLQFPRDIAENLAHLERWQQLFAGDAFTYEYYFMWDHYFDPAYYEAAKVLHADVRKLKQAGLHGVISDQTQRAYFPTGFGMYVLARSLWDDGEDFGVLAQDYFATLGPDGPQCQAYMARLSQLFDPPYLRGDKGDSPLTDRMAAQKLAQIPGVIRDFAPVIERNLKAADPCTAKSWEYLAYHAEIATLLAQAWQAKAENKPAQAHEIWERASEWAQINEDALQPVLDVYEFTRTLGRQF
jgi:hypothetical protein